MGDQLVIEEADGVESEVARVERHLERLLAGVSRGGGDAAERLLVDSRGLRNARRAEAAAVGSASVEGGAWLGLGLRLG